MTLTLIGIIPKIKNADEDKDFKYRLKEFKNFIIFLIIVSSFLIKIKELELYTSLENKYLVVIIDGLSF